MQTFTSKIDYGAINNGPSHQQNHQHLLGSEDEDEAKERRSHCSSSSSTGDQNKQKTSLGTVLIFPFLENLIVAVPLNVSLSMTPHPHPLLVQL